MSDWLTHLHAFFGRKKPFVVATVTSNHGNSPDLPGTCVFVSEHKTVSLVSSVEKRALIEISARSLLKSKAPYLIEKTPLGRVATEDNGYCDVIYEYFAATAYPSWLKQLKNNKDKEITSFLLREFPKQDTNFESREINTRIAYSSNDHPAIDEMIKNKISCQLLDDEKPLLLRSVSDNKIPLAIVGSHPVADKIVKLAEQLPISLTQIHTADCSEANLSMLEEGHHVVIMTQDHELDFTCCETILKHDKIAFVGCIGSEQKAQLFRQRLIAQSMPPEQCSKLYMPVGLHAVKGKQTSVVAMSILSQILSLNA